MLLVTARLLLVTLMQNLPATQSGLVATARQFVSAMAADEFSAVEGSSMTR